MEIAEVLGDLPHELLSLRDLGITEDVEETGVTHEENALLKAKFFYEKSGALPTLGEDSGVYVDAFPGQLGVYTRRWKGMGDSTDEQWINHFLREMESVLDEKRTAHFVCCAALIIDGKEYIVRGEAHGTITEELEAPLIPGIPISSCFKPSGFSKVYAALSPEEKNKISHRGKAMHKIREIITKHQAPKSK